MPNLGREVVMELIQNRVLAIVVKKCPVCGSLQHVRNQSVREHGCSLCTCPHKNLLDGTVPPQLGGMVCR